MKILNLLNWLLSPMNFIFGITITKRRGKNLIISPILPDFLLKLNQIRVILIMTEHIIYLPTSYENKRNI